MKWRDISVELMSLSSCNTKAELGKEASPDFMIFNVAFLHTNFTTFQLASPPFSSIYLQQLLSVSHSDLDLDLLHDGAGVNLTTRPTR